MPLFKKRLSVLLVFIFIIVAGCSFPGLSAPTEPSIDPVLTDAARTIEARLTSEARGPEPTATLGWIEFTPTPQLNETPIPAPDTLTPTTTSQVPTQGSCEDKVHFVSDVNYPDGTEIEAGTEFTKTWRLQNTGTCTWNADYAIVFERGDALGGPASKSLTTELIPPQAEFEISVDLKAPDIPGNYQGYWRLRNPAGRKFGTGENSDKDFWVKVSVGSTSGITYDFIAQASKATWISGGGGGEVTLNFGGDDGDPNGRSWLEIC